MIVHAYYPRTETRVQREAEALVDAGYAVDVICLRGEGEAPRERYRGVEVHRLPIKLNKATLLRQSLNYVRFSLLAGSRLRRLQLQHRYRTVQVHNLPDFLVFCALVPKLQGVPVILDLHDLMPEFFEGRFGLGRHGVPAALVRLQERLACRFADHVITVSDRWRQTLIARGVAEDKCSVVMNVADERIFTPRRRPGSNGTKLRLIYHGTLTYRYGLDLAIRAVGLVKDEIPGIRLTIMGSGDQRSDLLALRRELHLEPYVDLVDGWVPEEQLPDTIAQADLGVVPYRNDVFTDGILPTKLMEYAAVGLPCIAARTIAIETYFRGSMVEFFRPGDVDDLARCIRELHRSPERRSALADRSTRFTERYRWSAIGAEYVATVKRLGKVSAAR